MDYPVKKGERLTLDIVRAGDAGDGVAQVGGLTVFVEKTLPGERVQAVITDVQARFAKARAEKIELASGDRIAPPCPHEKSCGGCSMQFMDYKAHCDALVQHVAGLMQRVGGQKDYEMLPVLSMDEPWRYRNKAVFRAGGTKDMPSLGFVGKGTHQLVPATDCLLQTAEACTAAAVVQQWMRDNRITPYDERTKKGVLRHLMVRTNKRGQTMVVPVTADDRLPAKQQLIDALKNALPGLVSVVQNINGKPGQQILGLKCRVLYGQERLQDELMGLSFRLSALSFYQINRIQTEKLYGQALEFAALTGKETVVDAYCGAGTISLCMAKSAQHVIGVEIVPEAIADAKENAVRNGIPNAQFIVGACEDVLPRLVKEGLKPDVVMLDPPRKGCEQAVLTAVAGTHPQRIVYISCNPATLARDAGRLGEMGYALKKLRVCDMFSWTGEAECVALFEGE